MVNDFHPRFPQKAIVMGNYYGQPAPSSGDTTGATIFCKGVMAAIGLLGFITAFGVVVMVILKVVAG